MNYYIDAFRNYVNFSGRANRTQFWMFTLFNFIAGVILALVSFILPFFTFLLPLYRLAVLLPALAVGARRLHDTGRSAWWLLLLLLPVIGPIVLLVFYLQPGTSGVNRYDAVEDECCFCCQDETAGK